MPGRFLRESILESEAVNKLSPEAEVFYRRLMSVVDDFGRFDGRLSVLRCRLYPLQLDKVREASLERCLAECEAVRLVRLYTVDAKPYILLHKLGEPRAKTSKFPAPLDEDTGQHARTRTQTRANAPITPSSSVTPSTSVNGERDSRARDPENPADFAKHVADWLADKGHTNAAAYADWAARQASVCGLWHPGNLRQFCERCDGFIRHGVSVETLHAATDEIARRTEPFAKTSAMWGAINATIRRHRKTDNAAQVEEPAPTPEQLEIVRSLGSGKRKAEAR